MTEALTRRLEFDYAKAGVSPHQVGRLRDLECEVRKHTSNIGQATWHIGDALLKAREIVPHGQWAAWLESKCEHSERTAQACINVRENFKAAGEVRFGVGVAFLLAAPSTPEPARKEAVNRAAAGETIQKRDAQRIRDKHSPPKGQRVADLGGEVGEAPGSKAQRVADLPAPTVIETTAVEVQPKQSGPIAADLLPDLSRLTNQIPKVAETIDGQPFDGKTAKQHIVCAVNLLEGVAPPYVLVKPGDAVKKPGKFDPATVEIPPELDDAEFREAWAAWCQSRLEAKKPHTPTTAALALKKLAKHPLDVAIAAVWQSAAGGWKGVFPEKVEEPVRRRGRTAVVAEYLAQYGDRQ